MILIANFVSGIFVRLEVLPEALYNGFGEEAAFYQSFFDNDVEFWVNFSDALGASALEQAAKFGLSTLDALHVAAAISACVDEFVIYVSQPFHCMVLDAALPDTDGPTLAVEIKQGLNSKARIVMACSIGKDIERDPSISGWLNKLILPLQLRRLLAELISPEKSTRGDAVSEISGAGQEMPAPFEFCSQRTIP